MESVLSSIQTDSDE